MENCIGSEVTGIKIALFVIFDLTWTHIETNPNMEFLQQNFKFQSLRDRKSALLLRM